MGKPEIRKALDALTPPQRSAFALLIPDAVLAAIEPQDRERASRMPRHMASSHLFLPRIEPFLARWWRRLLGLPDEPEAHDTASASVSHMFPEGSLARRFSELHLDGGVLLPGDAPDLYLTRLATTSQDPVVGCAILVVEIAGSIAERPARPGSHLLGDIDFALDEFYEAAGAVDQMEPHLLGCLALAAAFDGRPETAMAARVRARELGRKSFGAGPARD